MIGLSTRKVGETLLSILGRPISAETVSQVAKTLDVAVAAFRRRPLQNRYQVLMLDGVVLARKTGAGALRRPVLVALGLRPDGKKEIIDFRLAASESAAEWEKFLTDLYRHGLTGEGLDMVCVDGGRGLLAALPIVLHGIPVQRCWAHKIRNILDKVRKADQPKSSAHSTRSHSTRSCMPTINLPRPRPLVSSPIASRKGYPNAVACLRDDLDELLTCFRYKSEEQRRRYEPPTPSNDASAKSGDRLGPWAPSRTKPAWTVSCSPSSLTKTSHKASVPLSC